jgi:TolB protein
MSRITQGRKLSTLGRMLGTMAALSVFAHVTHATDTAFNPDMLYHSLEPGVTHIYLANSATSVARPLLQSANKDFEQVDAKWSPDGNQIAFVYNQRGKFDIFVCDVDGKNLRQLTNQSGAHGQPTWSPDSRQVAFIKVHLDGHTGISVVSVEGGPVIDLIKTKAGISYPSWSPDGSQIAFSVAANAGSDIWVIRSDGANPTNLTATPKLGESQPTWSPDGRKLAFVQYESSAANLRVMDMATRAITKVTDDAFQNTFPTWAPDGSSLVFQSTLGHGVRTDIHRVPANGGISENLTANPAEDQDQAISQNGDKIVFTSFLSGEGQIYWMNIKTRDLNRVSQGKAMAYAPSWRPIRFQSEKAGQVSRTDNPGTRQVN